MMFSQYFTTPRIFKRLTKALIRLRICAGWSEPLLVAHTTLLEISCHGSIILFFFCFILFLLLFTSQSTIFSHVGTGLPGLHQSYAENKIYWRFILDVSSCILFHFLFDSLRPSQQSFSYVGTGLPVLNQY